MAESDPQVDFYVPDEQEAGAYANAFAVWSTAYDFALDFAALQRDEADEPDISGRKAARVVARVRIPTTLAFDLIRSINEAMTTHEAEWGEIVRPRRRDGQG